MSNTEQQNPFAARTVMAVLPEVDGGKLVEGLTANLQELSTAVAALRQAGSVTLKIVLKPSEAADNAMMLGYEIKLSKPKKAAKATLMFIDAEGSMSRSDPKQPELNLSGDGKVTRIQG